MVETHTAAASSSGVEDFWMTAWLARMLGPFPALAVGHRVGAAVVGRFASLLAAKPDADRYADRQVRLLRGIRTKREVGEAGAAVLSLRGLLRHRGSTVAARVSRVVARQTVLPSSVAGRSRLRSTDEARSVIRPQPPRGGMLEVSSDFPSHAAVRSERGAQVVRAALFSTYPPRECGIGTFSFDIRSALLGVPGVVEVRSVAVVDEPSSRQRSELLGTVSEGVRDDYVQAARMLGRLEIDVVLLQHEFGIFGGADGEYVLAFAETLSLPLVVTLHTVLSDPSPHQLAVLRALCARAERVIVMTETARRLLVGLGASAAYKVRVVPHGAPVVLARRRTEHAEGSVPVYVAQARGGYERLRSRFLLSTFGLLSAGKGLETAIKALPLIIERHPQVLYVIAGRTHPHVACREGEQYRLMLERLVVELDLGDHVEFDDRFLSIDELADLLAVTDVFVTPYRSREQVASGALTFALAAGCAAVSTPYWYAQDMLASGAGRLVPFDDPQALAEAVCAFAGQPDLLATARAEARRIGSRLSWPSVATATAGVLREATTRPSRRTRALPNVLSEPRVGELGLIR